MARGSGRLEKRRELLPVLAVEEHALDHREEGILVR
jgi:hypothetical protein